MKKTVRLTESDLIRIVEKVLNEQPEAAPEAALSESLEALKTSFNSFVQVCEEGLKKLPNSPEFARKFYLSGSVNPKLSDLKNKIASLENTIASTIK